MAAAEDITIDALDASPDDESVEDTPQVGAVVVQIFLNKAGLGATLVRVGLRDLRGDVLMILGGLR